MCKCLNPVKAYICGHKMAKDGVISPNLVFSENRALEYFSRIYPVRLMALEALEKNQIAIPCNKCAACQIQKRKDWSVRLCHEASQAEECCFITLTYNDDNCPVTDWRPVKDSEKVIERGIGNLPERTLLPSDVQKFMKRLRRHLEYVPKRKKDGRDHRSKIRYFAVGEYGSKTRRPHYHIIIFGWAPSDKEVLKTHNGKPVYRSAQVEKLWTMGYSSVTDVTPFVAKYCAKYVTKKFARLDVRRDLTDLSVLPEFTLSSIGNGGIGAPWFDKFGKDACRVGLTSIRVGSRISKCAIPRYYWSRLRKKHIDVWLECRDSKLKWINEHIGLEARQSDYDNLVRLVTKTSYYDHLSAQNEVF